MQGSSTLEMRPQATGRMEARAPSTAKTASLKGQEKKDTEVDMLSQRSRDRGRASSGTEALSPGRQDTRTLEGRRSMNKRPTTVRTEPARPLAPVLERGAEVLSTRGAGLPLRKTKGGATATVLPKQRAQSAPSSTPSQGFTTRTGPRLQAASFKSEPKWEFEENYSFDVGGLQTVSFPVAPALSCPAPRPHLALNLPPPSPSPPRLHPNLPSPNGQNEGGEGRPWNPHPSPGSMGRCE